MTGPSLLDLRYETDRFGVIHQVPPTITTVYDKRYVEDRYESYGVKTRGMAALRLGFMAKTILSEYCFCDVGYGNGQFLELINDFGFRTYGLDISGYPIPKGSEKAGSITEPFDVLTFFDSLEHFPSLDFLAEVKAVHICVTAPECHWKSTSKEFMNWKHRRPGEHIHHFNRYSLAKLMKSHGYMQMMVDNIEDAIRGEGPDGLSNTFTAIYMSETNSDEQLANQKHS